MRVIGSLVAARARGVAAALLSGLIACGGAEPTPPASPRPAGARSLCEAVDAATPATFRCIGEESHADVGTIGPPDDPFAAPLAGRCFERRASAILQIAEERATPMAIVFGSDAMADDRGRLPVDQLLPWRRRGGYLRAEPGAIARVRYRLEDLRLLHLRGAREAFLRALDDPYGRPAALSCLDDLCYRSHQVSLAAYVASAHVTVELDTGQRWPPDAALAGDAGSVYRLPAGDRIVLAARAEPGASFAGELCRASADAKAHDSAVTLARAILETAPCLVAHAAVEIQNRARGGRPCPPEELAKARVGASREPLARGCAALDAELRDPGGRRGLTCGPDLDAFLAARSGETWDRILRGDDASARFQLLRALLDGGHPAAMERALARLSRWPGGWAEAEQLWEQSRLFDGRLPSMPSATWSELSITILRRAIDFFGDPARVGSRRCEHLSVIWDENDARWKLVSRRYRPGSWNDAQELVAAVTSPRVP